MWLTLMASTINAFYVHEVVQLSLEEGWRLTTMQDVDFYIYTFVLTMRRAYLQNKSVTLQTSFVRLGVCNNQNQGNIS